MPPVAFSRVAGLPSPTLHCRTLRLLLPSDPAFLFSPDPPTMRISYDNQLMARSIVSSTDYGTRAIHIS